MSGQPRPMKFWELVSAFRTTPDAVREVVSRPAWRDPYGRWHAAFNSLVDTQDRDALDAPVPAELSRDVARLSNLKFLYSPRLGVLRESWPSGGRDPGPLTEMTAVEVHDLFGGWVIEEVFEYGSLQVTPAEVEDPDPIVAPSAPAPPRPSRAPSPEERDEEIRQLQARLEANPRDANAQHKLATALVKAGREREAVPHYVGLSDFFARDGFVTNARFYLAQAAKIDAEHPEVKARVERLE